MIGQFSSKFLLALCVPFFILASSLDQDSNLSQKKEAWHVTSIPTDGSWIILEDDNLYEISPPHWQVVTRWSDGKTNPADVKVVNTRNTNIDYPIDIFNKHTGETVQARYPKTVEEPPTEEAPSEDDESD
jgi:hypothetical protein